MEIISNIFILGEKMKAKEINLIFQFLEEIYENNKNNSSIKEIEKKLLEKLEVLREKNSSLNSEIDEIIDFIYELNGEIKYRYFEYGILAKTTFEETNLNWKEE